MAKNIKGKQLKMDSSEGWAGRGLGLNQAVLNLHRRGMVIPE